MIFAALTALSEGHDVTIVAFDMPRAVKIGRKMCRIAKALGIPCWNLRGNDPTAPRIRVRGFEMTPPIPTPRAKVFFDHSANFGRAVTPSSRSVAPLVFGSHVTLVKALAVIDEEIAEA